MANLIAVISKKEWEKLTRRRPDKSYVGFICFMLDRYDSQDPALKPLEKRGSRLFLATVRADDRLLLVAVLERLKRRGAAWRSATNSARVRDITALKEQLGLAAAPGKLGVSLRTPRALTDGQAELLRAAAAGKLPARPVAKSSSGPRATKRLGPSKAAGKRGGLSDGLRLLIEAAGTQIEEEYLDDLRDKPEKRINSGNFSETVQSIFSGAFDSVAETLPLLRQLAPFADGGRMLSRLETELKKGEDGTALANELVDAFAVSTLDVFATAIAALATGLDAKVPAAVRPLVPHLAKQVARIKSALAEG